MTSSVRLTAQPMAVEGLVVDQFPPPGTKVRREGTVMVQIWHPAVPYSPLRPFITYLT